jgi:hypothetical protein
MGCISKMLHDRKAAMKRGAVVFLLLVLGLAPASLRGAEVSEKQDLAIFGLTRASDDVPDDILLRADSSIRYAFVNLKRFNILGYGEYRIASEDIDDFVKRVREARAEKAKEAGTYDEKFGTVVIKGEDFDRIANSFLVVIPTVSGYTVSIDRQEHVSGWTTYVRRVYTVDMVIDITFVDVREGTQRELLRVTGSGSGEDADRAGIKAVENATSGLALQIRQMEAFRIRSGVVLVKGDLVSFEPGRALGVKPGDEYLVMTRQEVGETGRVVELPTGLVRVKRVYPELSEAKTVYQKERITEGDQLVEVAQLGAQVSFSAGMMKVDIPDMDYSFQLQDDSPTGDYYYIALDQKKRELVPDVGLRLVKNLGYRLKGVLDATALLNFPLFGGLGELGIGTTFYKRRLDIDLVAAGGVLYMTTFNKDLERSSMSDQYLLIDGTRIDFDQDPAVNIYGVTVGVKGGVGFNYRLSQSSLLRLALNYRLYSPIKNWRIRIQETAGGSKESVTIRSDSDNILEDAQSEGMKAVNISGAEMSFAYSLRF